MIRYLEPRARLEAACRQFFEAESFTEVTTPVRVPCPGTDVYIDPQPSGDHWLITSPEFEMKRLLAAGMRKIFQLARCHRRGELGDWHQPEFTLLEWYRAHAGHDDVLVDTERLLRHLAEHLDANAIDTRALKQARLLRSTVPDSINLQEPFERLSMQRAFQRYAGIDDVAALARQHEDRYFQLLVDRIEPALAGFERPVFLVRFPISQAALARPCGDDPAYAERFELYLAGIELCNGYGELTDAEQQRQRFLADQRTRATRGLPFIPIDEDFLAALKHLPPSGGNALGLERLIALLLGCPLREVFAFPAN